MLKQRTFFLLPLVIALLISEKSTAQSMAVPIDSMHQRAAIKFDMSFFDFGTIAEGKSVVKIFQFVNTGVDSLRIKDVKVTCGCTIPTYPKTPVAPGGVGEVQITFNTTGKMGRQLKVIRVLANTDPEETILQLSGEVKERKKGKRH